MGRGRKGPNKSSQDNELRAADETPSAASPSSIATAATLGPRKKLKREEYRQMIRTDEAQSAQLPKKKWFRQRAHANPFSDHRLSYPVGPEQMDWSKHYPAFIAPAVPSVARSQDDTVNNKQAAQSESSERTAKPAPLIKNIEIADIGCGYGGLLFALAPKMPDTLILGLEIRTAITEFVDSKIRALRHQSLAAASGTTTTNTSTSRHAPATPLPVPGHYANIATHRTNTMKFLPNLLPRASLRALFICFPDPHFKSRKHKARIVTPTLAAEYAHALAPAGLACTVTDVEELAGWMRARFDAHPAFARVLVGEERVAAPAEDGGGGGDERVWTQEDGDGDGDSGGTGAALDPDVALYVHLMRTATEEGAKVDRVGGRKFVGVWRRRPDPPWPGEEEAAAAAEAA